MSLLELLVVLLILGGMATLVVPAYIALKSRARQSAADAGAMAAARACAASLANNDPASYSNPAHVTGTCRKGSTHAYTGASIATLQSSASISAEGASTRSTTAQRLEESP